MITIACTYDDFDEYVTRDGEIRRTHYVRLPGRVNINVPREIEVPKDLKVGDDLEIGVEFYNANAVSRAGNHYQVHALRIVEVRRAGSGLKAVNQ